MFSSGASFTHASLLNLSRDIFVRKNPDGSILLMSSIDSEDKFFRVTGVAAEIFEKIDGKTTVGNIISSVKTSYNVKEEKIVADAEPFIEKLIKLNIVSVA
ncbi:MAG: PqqD family protein [Bdellovibrionota bacterium]